MNNYGGNPYGGGNYGAMFRQPPGAMMPGMGGGMNPLGMPGYAPPGMQNQFDVWGGIKGAAGKFGTWMGEGNNAQLLGSALGGLSQYLQHRDRMGLEREALKLKRDEMLDAQEERDRRRREWEAYLRSYWQTGG